MAVASAERISTPNRRGLNHGASRKVATAEPAWKSQVVLDATGHAGLSAWGFALDHDRSQTLAGSVDCSRESRRAATHNCEIIKCLCRPGLETGMFGKLG